LPPFFAPSPRARTHLDIRHGPLSSPRGGGPGFRPEGRRLGHGGPSVSGLRGCVTFSREKTIGDVFQNLPPRVQGPPLISPHILFEACSCVSGSPDPAGGWARHWLLSHSMLPALASSVQAPCVCVCAFFVLNLFRSFTTSEYLYTPAYHIHRIRFCLYSFHSVQIRRPLSQSPATCPPAHFFSRPHPPTEPGVRAAGLCAAVDRVRAAVPGGRLHTDPPL